MTRFGLASVAALGMLFVPLAAADGISDPIFSVEVCHDTGCVGVFNVSQADGTWQGGSFLWVLPQVQPIFADDGSGQLIATLSTEGGGTFIAITPGSGRSAAQVNLGFAMQSGGAPTTFTVKSALLTLDSPLANPQGRASVGINVSDADGDGAILTGYGPTGGAYLAQYNGFVPWGTTFDESIASIVTPDPFGTASGWNDTDWQPIAATVANMSTQVRFQLTANDFASGTSNFQIVPEPAGLLVLLAGLGLVRRR